MTHYKKKCFGKELSPKKQEREDLKGIGICSMIERGFDDLRAEHIQEHHHVLLLESTEAQNVHPSYRVHEVVGIDRWSPQKLTTVQSICSLNLYIALPTSHVSGVS